MIVHQSFGLRTFFSIAVLLVGCLLGRAEAASDGVPRREDRGGLIVLYLYGSYEEMGRQEAKLWAAQRSMRKLSTAITGKDCWQGWASG